jgi:hypothetical protein
MKVLFVNVSAIVTEQIVLPLLRIQAIEWEFSALSHLADTAGMDLSETVVVLRLSQLMSGLRISGILRRGPFALVVLTDTDRIHPKIKKTIEGGKYLPYLLGTVSQVPSINLEEDIIISFMEKVIELGALKRQLLQTYEEEIHFGQSGQTTANAILLKIAQLTGLSHTRALREIGNPAFQKAEKSIEDLNRGME